ncbi:hypothetical protein SteCoe_34312 [Stentor coeruleus]|uniref:Protein kinase domain-containing protein n=1 Tax=Stentor coeruleus TaxID=5963 RepID=A0A1R2AUU1_9CILI|nr:hypothetical protein SteCoe_34312 [Stentor coeruleus]
MQNYGFERIPSDIDILTDQIYLDISNLVSPSISFYQKLENLSNIYMIQENNLQNYSLIFIEKILPVLEFTKVSILHRLFCKDNRLSFHEAVLERLKELVINQNSHDQVLESVISEIKKCCGIDMNGLLNNFEFCIGENRSFYIDKHELESALEKNLPNYCTQLKINDIEIEIMGIIRKDDLPSTAEKEFFLNREFPKFHGYLSKTYSNEIYTIIFIDKPDSTLKENILLFNKLSKPMKNINKRSHECLTFNILKKLVQDLLFIKNNLGQKLLFIAPNNIFIYKGQTENDSPTIFYYPSFAKNSQNEGQAYVINFDVSSKRYLAPEYVNFQDYVKKITVTYNERNFDSALIWSLGAIILSMLTDNNIDKWNNLNFVNTKNNVINSNVTNPIIKEIVTESTNLDFRLRPSLEEIYQKLFG